MAFKRNCGKTASIITFALWWFQGKDRKGTNSFGEAFRVQCLVNKCSKCLLYVTQNIMSERAFL